jgi:predicted amidophosphoribosyltransferase
MRRWSFLIGIVCTLVGARTSPAQSTEQVCSQCSAALVQDVVKYKLDLTEQEALVDVMSLETYEQPQREINTGAKFPIEGFPFDGHLNAGE